MYFLQKALAHRSPINQNPQRLTWQSWKPMGIFSVTISPAQQAAGIRDPGTFTIQSMNWELCTVFCVFIHSLECCSAISEKRSDQLP